MLNNDKILILDKLSTSYGGDLVLKNINLSILSGEIISIMGPNGAGKSTVLKSIFGLSNIITGNIILDNEIIRPVPEKMYLSRVVFVPQGRQIFKSLTVKENLEIGTINVNSKVTTKERLEKVIGIFPVLRNKLKHKAKNLSGGQQQMVAIGRGLMAEPKILLLDEPTLGLSPKVVKEIIEKIKEINIKEKTSIVIVEHNIMSILKISDKVLILDEGQIVFDGKPADIPGGFIEKLMTE